MDGIGKDEEEGQSGIGEESKKRARKRRKRIQ